MSKQLPGVEPCKCGKQASMYVGTGYWVQCDRCKCWAGRHQGTLELAINAWNAAMQKGRPVTKTAVGPYGPMIEEPDRSKLGPEELGIDTGPSDLPPCPICDGRMVDIGVGIANHAKAYDPWCPLYGAAMSTDEWRYISRMIAVGLDNMDPAGRRWLVSLGDR